MKFKIESGSKTEIFQQTKEFLASLAFNVISTDDERPWGGFFVIDEDQSGKFADEFFTELPKSEINPYGNKISPKILLVEPGKKLSWQYHYRRAELWKVIRGPVGVITSQNDESGTQEQLENGQLVRHNAMIRHRLIGLDTWGVVAEIWQHTDPSDPSNEEDIVRVTDDFGR